MTPEDRTRKVSEHFFRRIPNNSDKVFKDICNKEVQVDNIILSSYADLHWNLMVKIGNDKCTISWRTFNPSETNAKYHPKNNLIIRFPNDNSISMYDHGGKALNGLIIKRNGKLLINED